MARIILLSFILLCFSCRNQNDLVQRDYNSGYWYSNLRISGTASNCYSVLMRFSDYEENGGNQIALKDGFVESLKTITSEVKSVKYFPMKLPKPRIGFTLCSKDSCEYYVLINGGVLNVSKRVIWYVDTLTTNQLKEKIYL